MQSLRVMEKWSVWIVLERERTVVLDKVETSKWRRRTEGWRKREALCTRHSRTEDLCPRVVVQDSSGPRGCVSAFPFSPAPRKLPAMRSTKRRGRSRMGKKR